MSLKCSMILKCSYEFRMTKITLKTVLSIFMRTCRTVSRQTCIKRESKSRNSQLRFKVIVVT